ncbi:alpha/beta hydrolase [Nocardioides sp. GXZ039]|uniref:alpha/beta hydrolase n=1 Tax=Nocardioides sp. GXZ039 TaxID=3136018 RepID=UPI0030F4648C
MATPVALVTLPTLPRRPRPVPPLTVAPESVRTCGAQLLAASAQVDDLGTFIAGKARAGDWHGTGSTSYHATLPPLGRQADAMSLALRGVAQRVDAHADEMESLVRRRTDLLEMRTGLDAEIDALEARAAAGPTAEEVVALGDDCVRVQGRVEAYEADVTLWRGDVSAEESEMVAAFERVLDLDAVDRFYGGVPDPADAALARRPGAGASATEVNDWWDSLTSTEQAAIIAAAPGSIGNLDGIPASARHAANAVALDRDLADWGNAESQGLLSEEEERWLENARAARDARDEIENRTDPVTGEPILAQIYIYDPTAFDGDGAIAISAGDLDTADNVAVVVPGLGTDAESAPYQADRAATLYESSRFLDPDETNASMFWIGYDAPDNLPWDEGWDWAQVVNEDLATQGGEHLADTIDGLRAARDGDPAHLTAIGHSYGSTTTGHAAHDHGLDVDEIVVVGSPGLGGDTDQASDLGIDPDHVWAGSNSRDPVAQLANDGWVHGELLDGAGLGDDPVEDDFGANRFEAEDVSRPDHIDFGQHSLYFEHNTESLYNISQIVNGDGATEATQAGHVHDPWWGGPQDPEWDRDPSTTTTQPRSQSGSRSVSSGGSSGPW